MANQPRKLAAEIGAVERKVLLGSGAWRWWLASAAGLIAGLIGAFGLFRWEWPFPIATAVVTSGCYLLAAISQGRARKIENIYREQHGIEG